MLKSILEPEKRIVKGLRPKQKKHEAVPASSRGTGDVPSRPRQKSIPVNHLQQLCDELLQWNILRHVCNRSDVAGNDSLSIQRLPTVYTDCMSYTKCWLPLVVEEIKANVLSSFKELALNNKLRCTTAMLTGDVTVCQHDSTSRTHEPMKGTSKIIQIQCQILGNIGDNGSAGGSAGGSGGVDRSVPIDLTRSRNMSKRQLPSVDNISMIELSTMELVLISTSRIHISDIKTKLAASSSLGSSSSSSSSCSSSNSSSCSSSGGSSSSSSSSGVVSDSCLALVTSTSYKDGFKVYSLNVDSHCWENMLSLSSDATYTHSNHNADHRTSSTKPSMPTSSKPSMSSSSSSAAAVRALNVWLMPVEAIVSSWREYQAVGKFCERDSDLFATVSRLALSLH